MRQVWELDKNFWPVFVKGFLIELHASDVTKDFFLVGAVVVLTIEIPGVFNNNSYLLGFPASFSLY